MRASDGDALRIRDLAAMTPFGKRKILDDVAGGYLAVVRVPCGHRGLQHTFLVEYHEAQRYLRALGLL